MLRCLVRDISWLCQGKELLWLQQACDLSKFSFIHIYPIFPALLTWSEEEVGQNHNMVDSLAETEMYGNRRNQNFRNTNNPTNLLHV